MLYPVEVVAGLSSGKIMFFGQRKGQRVRIVCREHRLEGSNPKLCVFFEGFQSRSTEVDRGRDSVWAISRRPEACRSSESHQIADLFMLYPVEVVAGLSSRKNIELLAEEGSKVDEFSREHRFEISKFSAR